MTEQTSRPAVTRRRVLQTSGVAAGATLLPASLHRAMAAPMRPGGPEAVEHVILLMQENRSFDHYYGSLRGVRGYGDRHPLRRRAGESVLHQAGGPHGDVLPFSLRQAAASAGRPDSDIQYLGDLPHGFTDATNAWAEGWYDGWVPAKTPATMTFYDRADIPLQYELAETFTTLDAYHCSVFGSTNPNRNYFWSGKTGNEPGSTARAVTNAAYSYAHAGYDWTTYPERLEAAGVSWQIYQEWDNFTDNAVEYFLPFKAIGRKMLAFVDGADRTTEEFYDSLHAKPAAEQDRLLAQLEEGRAALSPAERSLFDKAMYRSRPGTLVDRIAADIEAGTLPRVSWLVPTAALSEHPGASTPVGSAGLIYDLLDVVASHVETWSRSAVLVNFDENDGFFDHVPPPVAPRPPSGQGDDWYNGRPIGLGPRVPMTIVSPWTVGGYVDSAVADHTSTLRFLEAVTGVQEPNISAWRRSVCSDLTGAFDFQRGRRAPYLSTPEAVPSAIQRWRPAPPADQQLPEQERGRRAARETGYMPAASAAVLGESLRVEVANEGDREAAFTVYPFVGGLSRPEFVTVRRNRRQGVVVPAHDGRWDVVVQGPDRFWFEAAGSSGGRARGVDVRPETAPGRGQVRLSMVNTGSTPVAVVLESDAPASHRRIVLPPGARQRVNWPADHGWYDVEVTSPDDETFRRRLTGRA